MTITTLTESPELPKRDRERDRESPEHAKERTREIQRERDNFEQIANDAAVELAVLQALPCLPTPHRIAGRVGRAIPAMPEPLCELIGGYTYCLDLCNGCGRDHSYRDDLRALKAALDIAQRKSVESSIRDLPTSTEALIRRLCEEDLRESAGVERTCG